MTSSLNLIRKAVEIVQSVYIFLFVPFILETYYAHLAGLNLGLPFFILHTLLFMAIKSYLYAGIWASLVELGTGEEIVLSTTKFFNNAAKFWMLHFLLSLGAFFANFILFWTVFHQTATYLASISSFLNILVSTGFIAIMLFTKHLWRSVGPLKDTRMLSGLVAISLFYGAEMALRTAAFHPWINDLGFSSATFLLAQYCHLCAGMLFILIIAKDKTPETAPARAREIYLINPTGSGVIQAIASLFQRNQYPAFFSVLKALTPPGYRFREFIRVLWHKRYYAPGKLVAISCYTPNCYEAYTIAKGFRRSGSKVIMGGPHVTCLPDEALLYCDSIVVGEAEGVWAQIVEDFEKDCLKPVYRCAPQPEDYQRVYNGLINSSPAVIGQTLETTSGCKFKCDFCAIPGLSNGRVRTKSVEDVVALIKKASCASKHVAFIDNNIYSDPGYARELFKALIPLKVQWSSQCTIDIAKNEQTLQLAKESGCEALLCGFEIGERSAEQRQKGKFSIARHYADLARRVKRKGLKLKGNFIYGFDSDTFKDLFRLWVTCFKIWPTVTILYYLTPMPGSQVFLEMLKNDRITNLNWREYNCAQFLFRHKNCPNALLNILYPVLYPFFLMTTSSIGLILGLTLISVVMAVLFGNLT